MCRRERGSRTVDLFVVLALDDTGVFFRCLFFPNVDSFTVNDLLLAAAPIADSDSSRLFTDSRKLYDSAFLVLAWVGDDKCVIGLNTCLFKFTVDASRLFLLAPNGLTTAVGRFFVRYC